MHGALSGDDCGEVQCRGEARAAPFVVENLDLPPSVWYSSLDKRT